MRVVPLLPTAQGRAPNAIRADTDAGLTMEPKHPSDVICEYLESLADAVRELMPFLLLFITASIAGIAFIISKIMLEGAPALNLLGRIVFSIELLLLLIVAGNAVGSYTTARLLLSSIEDKKRSIILKYESQDPAKFITDAAEEFQPSGARLDFFFKNSYFVLSFAVVLGAVAALVRIWT
jgi:hypothetical protein